MNFCKTSQDIILKKKSINVTTKVKKSLYGKKHQTRSKDN